MAERKVERAIGMCANVHAFLEVTDWVYEVKRLVHTPKMRELCLLAYPNHPKGCPKYGKNDGCPPAAPYISEFFDLTKPVYLVHSEFDLQAHIRKMREKHPHWTERQAKCVLYWQPRSRKQLMERTQLAMKELGCNLYTTCPEAMGVNVFVTSNLAGLVLEPIKGLHKCRHVSLIGFKNI